MDDFVLNRIGGGGIGLAIKLYTTINCKISNEQNDRTTGSHSKIAKIYVNYLKEKYKITEKLNIHIEQPFKSHIGLATSSAVVIGIICCFNELFSLNLSYNDFLSLHSSKIIEEHNNIIGESFLTGVSSWAMCLGGIVIVDTNGLLLGQYTINENNVDSVLIISPQNIIGNTIEDEINLLKGNGTKLDLRDKAEKELIFLKIKEYFENGNQKMGLIHMNELLSVGSKIAEIDYQNHNYNGLISKLLYFGRKYNILTMGMSSIGPSVFFLDDKDNINRLLNDFNNFNESIHFTLTSVHNDCIKIEK
jgi:predicted sugar kinase